MAAPGYVTLLAPSGADQGPVSHGAAGYLCYREHGASGRLLVDVPEHTAPYFCNGVGGFTWAPPELQSKQEGL